MGFLSLSTAWAERFNSKLCRLISWQERQNSIFEVSCMVYPPTAVSTIVKQAMTIQMVLLISSTVFAQRR